MKIRLLTISMGLLIILSACSDKKTEPTTATAEPAAASQSLSGAALPTGGKVIKAMHAGGYTYMEMENAGQQFWVASNMMNVKQNDMVIWHDAAVMKNFQSSALHRTFDEILFVSSATVQ